MVDIHTHVLPCLDDGARDLEESVAMLEVAGASGTTDIVATPHANHDYRFDPERVSRAAEELRGRVNTGIRIHSGCEVHFTVENVRDALAHPRKYGLNQRACVLLEFPETPVPRRAGDILKEMLAAGIFPVLAHPERNAALQKDLDRIAGWVESGVLVQITAQSLLGRFGREAKAAADQMIARGLAHFVASDAHDAERRPPSLREAHAYVERRYGAEVAACLFVDNPACAISGGMVPPCPMSSEKRRWFRMR